MKLTKASNGIQYGDVSNAVVRNILTEISKQVYGKFIEQDMEDTMEFFDWKCPYTGKDLKDKTKGIATDHIVPQNRDFCGLNIRGNLVLVDKEANSKKGSQSVEEFFFENSYMASVPLEERKARLAKIKEWQEKCNYDPEIIRKKISPFLKEIYDEARKTQESYIAEAIKMADLKCLTPIKKPTETKGRKKKISTELILSPSNDEDFKKELLEKKYAKIVLTYDSGRVVEKDWKADNFSNSSNVRGNIQSKTFWRTKDKDGLIKVELFVK